MCLLVWIGTSRPVPRVEQPVDADPVNGYHGVEEVLPDALIRGRLGTPHVAYVASHEGCGCGYRSSTFAAHGMHAVADVIPLLAAMGHEERLAFLAEQRSRERLRDLVARAAAHGPVHVYACRAGDEDAPPRRVELLGDPAFFAARTEPLAERVLYIFTARHSQRGGIA
jgi:hypothetical protein